MAALFELHSPTARTASVADVSPARPPLTPVRVAAPPRRCTSVGLRRAFTAVAAAMAVVVLLLLGSAVLGGTQSAAAGVAPSGEFHVVSEGDTLYSVAQQWAPAAPVSYTIERIEDLNGGPLTLVPGDVIALPLPVQ